MWHLFTMMVAASAFEGAAPAKTANVPEYCKTVSRSVEGLPQIRGRALRAIVVGRTMLPLHNNTAHESSTFFGPRGKYTKYSGANELEGTYTIRNDTVWMMLKGQRQSFQLFRRKDGIIVAHFVFFYNRNEIANICVEMKRLARDGSVNSH